MKTVYNVFCLPFHIVLYLGDLKKTSQIIFWLSDCHKKTDYAPSDQLLLCGIFPGEILFSRVIL